MPRWTAVPTRHRVRDRPLRPFRFGLIGAGVAAEIHLAAMRTIPASRCSRDRRRRPRRGPGRSPAGTGSPRCTRAGEALAARAPVDAVAVLTPHHLHLPTGGGGGAGRHVLVEKAIAHTVAAADELIEACRAPGVTLAGIFQNRFTPAARRLRDAVAGGALGRVFLASVTAKEHRAPRYFRIPLARPEGGGRRRRPDDPGHPHDRPAPLGAGHAAAGAGAHRHGGPRCRGGGRRRRPARIRGRRHRRAAGHDGGDAGAAALGRDPRRSGHGRGQRQLGVSRVPAAHGHRAPRRGVAASRRRARRPRSSPTRRRSRTSSRPSARAGPPWWTAWKPGRRW